MKINWDNNNFNSRKTSFLIDSPPYPDVSPPYAPVSPPYESNLQSYPISQLYSNSREPYIDLNKNNINKEIQSEEENEYEEQENDISQNILNKKNKEIKNKYDKLSEREKILISDLLKKDDEEKKTILTDIENENEKETEKENEIKKIIKI